MGSIWQAERKFYGTAFLSGGKAFEIIRYYEKRINIIIRLGFIFNRLKRLYCRQFYNIEDEYQTFLLKKRAEQYIRISAGRNFI